MQRCSRSGRRTCPIRSIQLRQNSNAMLKVTAEQIGHEKLPAQPLAERSAGSAFEAGAGLPRDEQNCPPTPLSAKPIVCPCAKPQANTLNRTQKYSIQAMSERSERVSFMAATLPSNIKSVEAQPALRKNGYTAAPGSCYSIGSGNFQGIHTGKSCNKSVVGIAFQRACHQAGE